MWGLDLTKIYKSLKEYFGGASSVYSTAKLRLELSLANSLLDVIFSHLDVNIINQIGLCSL